MSIISVEPMNDASEDEHEDVFADVANDLQLKSSRSRAEQHEQLRRMMDDEGRILLAHIILLRLTN